jgi:NifU-like protein involved in Fe-S cluster formation
VSTTTSHPLSAKALARLRKPRTRGAFMPLDAARRQLGLLAVSDTLGQARISWLVDLATGVIEDARFLAFGALASHALADVFTESARGRSVADACRLTVEQLESLLRDDPTTPAIDPADAAFIPELQRLAEAELPRVKVLPKPVEVEAYQRKRQQDWDDQDRAWLPLSLLKKIGRVDAIATRVLRERLGAEARHEIAGLHDDFRVVLAIAGASDEQLPTLAKLIEDALRAELHPRLVVEASAKPAPGDKPSPGARP